jgi:hypothetical protein
MQTTSLCAATGSGAAKDLATGIFATRICFPPESCLDGGFGYNTAEAEARRLSRPTSNQLTRASCHGAVETCLLEALVWGPYLPLPKQYSPLLMHSSVLLGKRKRTQGQS